MNNKLGKYQERWKDTDSIDFFSNKTASQFFRTETFFLKDIIKNNHKILDIGCASGRLLEVIYSYKKSVNYFGMDIVPKSIEIAKNLYPNQRFICSDALEYNFEETFDFINATGVFQHEPRYEKLLNLMFNLSNKYILFDVKFANIQKNIIDLDVSYSGKKNRLFFIILNLQEFLNRLKSISYVSKIHVFGYITPTNKNTVIPMKIKEVTSAGVLIELDKFKKSKSVDIKLDLPEYLID